MVLHNPVMSEQDKYISSIRASNELIGAVKGKRVFSATDHIRSFKGGMRDGKNDRYTVNDKRLKIIVSNQGSFEKLFFLRAKHTVV